MTQQTGTLGLKRLRANPHAEKKRCPNCKCVRFGECGCQRKRR